MQKPVLILRPATHRELPVLLLGFHRNDSLLTLLRSNFPHTRWSSTLKSWYLPYAESLSSQIIERVQHVANIQEEPTSQTHESPKKNSVTIVRKTEPALSLPALSEDHSKKIEQFTQWMRSRRYADNTIQTYTDGLRIFMRYFSAKNIELISNEDLIDFNNQYILAHQFSGSYQNQIINAVKLFFRNIQLRSMDIALVHRPKPEHKLPNVLSKEEVKSILQAPTNIKHKAMLSVIYSCGLRCGELLRLKFEHVDSKRNLLVIKQSKGKKDRIVPLSKKIIELLRDYYKACHPKVFLFEGQHSGSMYDERSLQQVLKQSLSKTGINKPVTLHWLRHSYATHLLESGTDLRYIQEILGHSRSTTTEIYTHVSTRNIQNVISPFDDL